MTEVSAVKELPRQCPAHKARVTVNVQQGRRGLAARIGGAVTLASKIPVWGTVIFGLLAIASTSGFAGEFGIAGNPLSEYAAVKYESIYTRVPTTGKLVSVKMTDSGKIFYICREKTGFVIYNLEIRPIEGFKDKIEKDLKDKGEKWELMLPDELLFTKDRYDRELKRRLKKYCEIVWVRNEIRIDEPPKRDEPRQ